MSRKILRSAVVIFLVLSLAFLNISASASKSNSDFSPKKVLEARFLNMLNHSHIYNDTFDNVENIVNNAVIDLLQMRSEESFISENVLNSYLFNMFGITVDDFSDINSAYPKKAGYVYIIPRGYTKYSHKAISVKENVDGSYTFFTTVIINPHDGDCETATCETLFVKNAKSSFGYNIKYSNITDAKMLNDSRSV